MYNLGCYYLDVGFLDLHPSNGIMRCDHTLLINFQSEYIRSISYVQSKFYCSLALADGNQGNRIREKTLMFSPTVLSGLFPYDTQCSQLVSLWFNGDFNSHKRHAVP